jgi:hypothetical protein
MSPIEAVACSHSLMLKGAANKATPNSLKVSVDYIILMVTLKL